MSVRKFNLSNSNNIKDIKNLFIGEGLSYWMIDKPWVNYHNFIGYFDDQKICGILIYKYKYDNIFVHSAEKYDDTYDTYTKPTHILVTAIIVGSNVRRQGIATKLLSYLINMYDDMSFCLHVSINNKGAIKLYRNFDFYDMCTIHNYYDDSPNSIYTETGRHAYKMVKI